MGSYLLFDYESTEWHDILDQLGQADLRSANDVKTLILGLGRLADDTQFKTLDVCLEKFSDQSNYLGIFKRICQYAQKLQELFPSGRISRLGETCSLVQFTRRQVLCLLCHMILCTLKKSKRNMYWVTFENWLTDGRTCAAAYLETLLEFFRQSFAITDMDADEFMSEPVIFKLNSVSSEQVETHLASTDGKLHRIDLRMEGSIGDEPFPEVDFANCDIGYGITGTQEEMLFGASPELCIAMLFCDTLKDHQAISIQGARKVSAFNGYGLNVTVKSFIPREERIWRDRVIIAIDALDFSSEMNDSFTKQLTIECLNRELVKAYAGFSLVKNTTISTGHSGCGAFGGNKQLKALIQLVAASLTHNDLLFYSYGDAEFFKAFSDFLTTVRYREISIRSLWQLITKIKDVDEQGIFEHLKSQLLE